MSVVALSGGIGGAKLALGLAQLVPGEELVIAANVADDFEHLGLSISPDIDTLLYTLSGQNNEELGWGRRGETWAFMEALQRIGGESWFRLGDGDLALHVERTRRLGAGARLSEITRDLARSFGIGARILPATDDRLRTRLRSGDAWLDFQDYFVRQHCEPVISAIDYTGAATATPQPELIAALRDSTLRAVVICPSNPFVSILPILAVPGIREALQAASAPVIAVSPIIGGQAVKGPTAKLLLELGHEVSSPGVTRCYERLIDAVVIDEADAELAAAHCAPAIVASTMMTTLADKVSLARRVLSAADELGRTKNG